MQFTQVAKALALGRRTKPRWLTIDRVPLHGREGDCACERPFPTWRAAGIKGVRTSPHTLRHSFAKAHVLNGGDAFSLQRMLGHADVSTTQKYVDRDLREVRRQHDAFGPLDRLGDKDGR